MEHPNAQAHIPSRRIRTSASHRCCKASILSRAMLKEGNVRRRAGHRQHQVEVLPRNYGDRFSDVMQRRIQRHPVYETKNKWSPYLGKSLPPIRFDLSVFDPLPRATISAKGSRRIVVVSLSTTHHYPSTLCST
jgi:hypothetical protein